jgi:hypothetical protein
MSRQIGAVLGIAVFVAVLGTPVGPDAVRDSFTDAWLVLGAIGLLSAVVAVGMTPRARDAGEGLPA